MNVADSSAWLEYFANGSNASFFASAIERAEELLVPSLALYEVFKRVLQQRDEDHALQAVAVMQQGAVIDLDARLALVAARIRLERKLPMADSVILATGRTYGATVWTQGADFRGCPASSFGDTSLEGWAANTHMNPPVAGAPADYAQRSATRDQ